MGYAAHPVMTMPRALQINRTTATTPQTRDVGRRRLTAKRITATPSSGNTEIFTSTASSERSTSTDGAVSSRTPSRYSNQRYTTYAVTEAAKLSALRIPSHDSQAGETAKITAVTARYQNP